MKLIDTTLREGEQFATAHFSPDDKRAIVDGLDALGIDLIEVTSPAASPQAFRDGAMVARRGLRARVVAHVRCHVEDVERAIEAGVTGVGLYFATSEVLRRAGHGLSIGEMLDRMGPPIERARRSGLEVRFSSEDSFRSDGADLESVFAHAVRLGVDRLGVADTVGIATPRGVRLLLRRMVRRFSVPFGFHGHNDTGSAIANAWEALEAGAEYLDVSILGIGERVGITPLGGLIARGASLGAPWAARLDLRGLRALESRVARAARVEVPFSTPLTGPFAFAHAAGPHVKAMLADPNAYEVLAPESVDGKRRFVLGTRVTGRHAVADRAGAMGVTLTEAALQEATNRVKALGDEGRGGDEEIERAIRERE